MAEIPPDNSTNQRRRQSDQVRLESWKAIANHLKRSVRTVRRWEATEGLPVHRHRHLKGFTVFAFRSELNAWRAKHHESLQSSSFEDATAAPAKSEIRFSYYAMILVAALIVGVVGGRYMLSFEPVRQNVVSVPSLPTTDTGDWPEIVAQVLVAPVFLAWAEGRVQDAYRASQIVRQQLPGLSRDIQDVLIDELVEFSLTLGRIDDANTLLAGLSDTGLKRDLQARVEFASGDMTRVRDVLKASGASGTSTAAQAEVLNAMDAMKGGNMAEAKSRLRHATNILVVADSGYFFVALDMLANVLKSEGEFPEAVAVLERTMPLRAAAAQNRSGLFWLMCQGQLAKAYREVGRDNDADRVENELRDFLILSDENFPLARSLATT